VSVDVIHIPRHVDVVQIAEEDHVHVTWSALELSEPSSACPWLPEGAYFVQAGQAGAGRAELPSFDGRWWSVLAVWDQDPHERVQDWPVAGDGLHAAWHVVLAAAAYRGDAVLSGGRRPFAALPARGKVAGAATVITLAGLGADQARGQVPLTFAVLGDYGVGIESDAESSRRQRRVAEVVERLVVDRAARFVVTTGDNVYEGERGRSGTGSGATDGDWWSSFYAPYRYTISRVPIYPALGNHDSSDSEQSDDRQQMYDNFHTASRFAGNDDPSSVDPGLHYVVRWGADVELVAVDTSQASDLEAHRYFQNPKHQRWLQEAFHRPGPRWRIRGCRRRCAAACGQPWVSLFGAEWA